MFISQCQKEEKYNIWGLNPYLFIRKLIITKEAWDYLLSLCSNFKFLFEPFCGTDYISSGSITTVQSICNPAIIQNNIKKCGSESKSSLYTRKLDENVMKPTHMDLTKACGTKELFNPKLPFKIQKCLFTYLDTGKKSK